MEVVVAYLTH